MRGASVSDLHLGFRAYSATENGRNLRELDVERAWDAAVQAIIDSRPDLVTIAGDIFHHPRVGQHAVKSFRDGLRRIVTETDAHVVVIQGNHDAGKTAEVLTPIVIPDDLPRVLVVTQANTRYLTVGGAREQVAITCLPCETLSADDGFVMTLERDPDVDVHVLLIHAAVNTSAEDVERLPMFYAGAGSLDVGRLAEEFDVVAAGDFHEFRRLHPTRLAFYSGSIERTSSNIWPETAPKGVVVWDTVAEQLVLAEIATRPMRDLGQSVEPTAEAVNAFLSDLRDSGQGADAIVRVVVEDFPRDQRDQIDWALVRELKHACSHFQLDLRLAAAASAEEGDRRDRVGRSLMDEATDFFESDPEDVRECALAYLGGEHA